MCSGTWKNQYRFLSHELVLCAQNVQSIYWGTILGQCDDTIEDLIRAALEQADAYTAPAAVGYLRENLSAPLSLCTLGIQTENNTLELTFQEEKTLQLTLPGGERYSFMIEVPASPTFQIPAAVICDIMEPALFLLSASTPQQVERSLQKLEIFGTGPALIPIS